MWRPAFSSGVNEKVGGHRREGRGPGGRGEKERGEIIRTCE